MGGGGGGTHQNDRQLSPKQVIRSILKDVICFELMPSNQSTNSLTSIATSLKN